MIKTLGILTSGGDSPGMNSAIRAVVRTALRQGARVVGFRNGYDGIFDGTVVELNDRVIASSMDRGGTMLQSSRCKRFYHEDQRLEAFQRLREMEVAGLIVVGGDGSLRGARELSRMGLPTIGIPGSIDNDIWGTEMCVGVDTAANTILSMVDRIKDTARSHRRCFLIEVMGRNSGYLGLISAISCGAEIAVIPEFRPNYARILERMNKQFAQTRDNSMIMLSEGVCHAEAFIERLREEKESEVLCQEIRKTVLGHVQRGGSPSHFDRVLASRMGELAVIALLQGETGSMTALQKSRVTLLDFDKTLGRKKHPALELIRLARNLDIDFGDPVEV